MSLQTLKTKIRVFLLKPAISVKTVILQNPYGSGRLRVWPGQQIGSKIDSFQNVNFLISQPNPMMLHSLESSRRDDFNEGHIIGFDWEMKKISWKEFCSLFLNCSPINPKLNLCWPPPTQTLPPPPNHLDIINQINECFVKNLSKNANS